MHPKLKVAIIGGGRIGYVHAVAIQQHVVQAEVKYLIDPYLTPDLEAKFQAINVKHFSQDVNVALSDSEVDVVYVCTPTPTHAQLVLDALKAGKHVFCEKPISLDLATIKKVQVAVKNSQKVFTVGHNRRFDHNYHAVKQTVLSQKLGEILQVKISSRDPGLPPISYLKSSGGLFYDMMIHDLDMARFIMNKPVVAVYAHGGNFFDPEVASVAHDIDTACVTLIFADQTMAMIDNCRVTSYGYDQRLEVHGTKGMAKIENDLGSTLVVANENGVTAEKPLHFFLERYMGAYVNENVQFFNAIINKTPPLVTVDDGYEAVLLAYAATCSLKTKKVVYLKDLDN